MSRDIHSCTHWLRPRNHPPLPPIGTRYWSPKIFDISLCNPLVNNEAKKIFSARYLYLGGSNWGLGPPLPEGGQPAGKGALSLEQLGGSASNAAPGLIVRYKKRQSYEIHCKKVSHFPIPSRDVTNQTLPGGKYFIIPASESLTNDIPADYY
jgi:hypothetical protein